MKGLATDRSGVARSVVYLVVAGIVWFGGSGKVGGLVRGGEASAAEHRAAGDPKRELEELNRQLDQKKRQQQATAKKERSVLGDLEALDHRIHLRRRQMAILDQQIREQSRTVSQLNDEVAGLERNVVTLRRSVAVRLRAVYMSGVEGEWAMLFGAGDYQDLLERLDGLQRIAASESSMLTDYDRRRTELAATLRDQRDASERLDQQRRQLAAVLQDIDSARSDKRVLLAKVRTERAMTAKAITELEESAKQLQALLQQLEREAANRKIDGRLAQAKGRLPWPYDGAVVGLFGRQRHSQYNTDIFRRGIEIKAHEGDDVKAVHQGVVAFADWFKGYGLVVVLDHGDHYYTLYAHLGRLDVKVGQAVSRGQVIGVVGETGMSDEQTLYFELRHHGTPLDPLTWLKKRG
ncbi:MAG TPA: peptidoglycan DD-metalloendopeptidase family protein [Nitrospiria bacterium]|nr:peptidoglycan DD-metalloendopeptidase family protein [Nitrospiria bacterium]